MGNAAGLNNTGGNILPSVNNCSVTLCHVYSILTDLVSSTCMLSVLAVLKQHDFEIKPMHYGYFCELRKSVPPCSSETLDREMREAIPAHLRNNVIKHLRWHFA